MGDDGPHTGKIKAKPALLKQFFFGKSLDNIVTGKLLISLNKYRDGSFKELSKILTSKPLLNKTPYPRSRSTLQRMNKEHEDKLLGVEDLTEFLKDRHVDKREVEESQNKALHQATLTLSRYFQFCINVDKEEISTDWTLQYLIEKLCTKQLLVGFVDILRMLPQAANTSKEAVADLKSYLDFVRLKLDDEWTNFQALDCKATHLIEVLDITMQQLSKQKRDLKDARNIEGGQLEAAITQCKLSQTDLDRCGQILSELCLIYQQAAKTNRLTKKDYQFASDLSEQAANMSNDCRSKVWRQLTIEDLEKGIRLAEVFLEKTENLGVKMKENLGAIIVSKFGKVTALGCVMLPLTKQLTLMLQMHFKYIQPNLTPVNGGEHLIFGGKFGKGLQNTMALCDVFCTTNCVRKISCDWAESNLPDKLKALYHREAGHVNIEHYNQGSKVNNAITVMGEKLTRRQESKRRDKSTTPSKMPHKENINPNTTPKCNRTQRKPQRDDTTPKDLDKQPSRERTRLKRRKLVR